MDKPRLYIFSGLPASGKTTLAKQLAAATGSCYLRIDTVEQGLRDLARIRVEGEGYRLSYRIAQDNLSLGLSVVADSCNPIALTRREWEETAESAGASFVNIEVVCSDRIEHRRRAETRESQVPDLKLPDWDAIKNREYHPWRQDVVRVDTAGRTEDACFKELLQALKKD